MPPIGTAGDPADALRGDPPAADGLPDARPTVENDDAAPPPPTSDAAGPSRSAAAFGAAGLGGRFVGPPVPRGTYPGAAGVRPAVSGTAVPGPDGAGDDGTGSADRTGVGAAARPAAASRPVMGAMASNRLSGRSPSASASERMAGVDGIR
jgi:hypothetical protein